MAQAHTDKPTALRIIPANIPQALKDLQHWVQWRFEKDEDGKWTKVPYRVHDPTKRASSTNAITWSSFGEAMTTLLRNEHDGIGFVVTIDCRIVGIDLDHCRDPETGKLDERGERLIKRFNSYTEVSPSGTGIRIFVIGSLPEGPRKVGDYEVYASGRYLTVTGHPIEGTPTTVEERSDVLADFVKWLGAESNDRSAPVPPDPAPKPNNTDVRTAATAVLRIEDAHLISRASQAKNGADFNALWRGDITAYDNDDSRADLALCNHLAFWTGKDAIAIDRLFRHSSLYREKWDEPRKNSTYGRNTIDEAIAKTTEVYKEPGKIVRGRAGRAPTTPTAVSAFPLDALPDAIASFVEEGARAHRVKPDMLGVAALSYVGGAIAGSRVILIKPGWEEPGNLWCALVVRPGGQKTPLIWSAGAPLVAREKYLQARYPGRNHKLVGRGLTLSACQTRSAISTTPVARSLSSPCPSRARATTSTGRASMRGSARCRLRATTRRGSCARSTNTSAHWRASSRTDRRVERDKPEEF